jgi:hypothetical protein
MTATGSSAERRRLAATYAAGVAALLEPPAVRGVSRAAPARRAARLLATSQALKTAAETTLKTSDDPFERAEAEVQLLAGAVLDLTVASQLTPLPAAVPEGRAAVRALFPTPADLAGLRALISAPDAYLVGALAGRGVRAIGEARADASAAVHAALEEIKANVVTAGGHVVEGLLMLDAALLKEALVTVGGELLEKLGVDVKGISRRVIDFVMAANDKIIALLGINALDKAREQLNAWLEELKAGTLFPQLVDKLLGTAAIAGEVDAWISAYRAEEAVLWMVQDEVTQLAGRFAAKASVADKITTVLALVKLAPPLATPAGRLAVAGTYLGLLAYLIGSGYDHVDSDRIQLLDWVEGVRGVARRLLAPDQPPA